MSPVPEIGVVVALPVEAESFGAKCRKGGCMVVAGARVAVAGIGCDHAAAAAEALVGDGIRVLVSWGIAGGLSPLLDPGDLVMPERVVSEHNAWDVDAAWRTRFAGALAARTPSISGGSVWCSRSPIASIEEKRMLAARGLVATDMESAAVAVIAAAARLPFVAIKAICDPADRTLPPAALRLLDADGRLRLRGLAGAIRAGPGAWRELNALRRDFTAARDTLRHAARALTLLS